MESKVDKRRMRKKRRRRKQGMIIGLSVPYVKDLTEKGARAIKKKMDKHDNESSYHPTKPCGPFQGQVRP